MVFRIAGGIGLLLLGLNVFITGIPEQLITTALIIGGIGLLAGI